MPERFLDVSHEALIRGWPRLRGWLDEDRAGLRLQRRITEAAEEWQHSNRDNDLLYRGARLMQAQEWRAHHDVELNPVEREFLDASIVLKQRVEEEKRLHEAESERVKLLLEKRKRTLIFGVTVFAFGVLIIIALAALGYQINQKRKLMASQRQILVGKGRVLRENANAVLRSETNDPTRDVIALRSLATALSLNPEDTEAAKMARDLLLRRDWCPPAAPAAGVRQDTILAATFAPGTNNEIFAVLGDGQLRRWKGYELTPVQSLFEKPESDDQRVVKPAFASFSPDGQWLLTIPPTRVSVVTPDGPVQGGTQQRATISRAYPGLELCDVQIWRWSAQKRTYQSVGTDFEIQRFLGSPMMNFAWSYDSNQVVLISRQSGAYNAKCNLFRVKGSSVEEIPNGSEQLTGMKIVAIAFSPDGSRVAAVSSERKVLLIRRDDFQVIPSALDATPLPEGFQPIAIAFGPGDDELTLTSWGGIQILNIQDGKLREPIHPTRTFSDQFMRMVIGPGDFATRLVATSFYGRVEVAKGSRMQEPAEPVMFGGSMGIAQFSPDGLRLLILSGGVWNAFDRMRLVDVTSLYRTQERAAENFEEKPAPPWLADIASAASSLDARGDGSLLTLETVRQRYPGSKAGDAYEAVWRRFFPDEKSNGHLKTNR